MSRIGWIGLFAAALLRPQPGFAAAAELSNRAFRIRYDDHGIRSLKRTDDIHDTEYLSLNGTLGSLIIRYRSAPNGDWRELRESFPADAHFSGSTLRYRLGTELPTLAAKSTGSAAVGAGGLRGLNDGHVPLPSAGRGGGRAARPGPPGFGAAQAPSFTWSGSRGEVQWVQYTFPTEEEVSRSEVFWVADPAGATVLPQSWRLLYRVGREWKEVRNKAPYTLEANAFNTVEFAPVRTMALRIEARMAPNATVGIAEWRVGPDRLFEPAADLKAEQSFKLDGETLDWTVTLANTGAKRIEIGSLAVPFNFAERTGARGDIYTRKLLRHALVAGHGSWVFWQRSNGAGPYLVMTPTGQMKFEYFESAGGVFTPYVHAEAAAAAAIAAGGNWRLPVTNLKLEPKGASGSTAIYGFRFQWAGDFAAVREVLFKEGKFDTVVVPGMTIPSDLAAMISLRTRNRIEAVEAEHLDADRYLERAYRTAVAYWTVPMAVEKWSANAVGTMNEAFIPELIQTLEEEGKGEWADTLRGYWEGKVDRFINHTPNLYGSEFAFDSTGFESTGSFAKYAMKHVLKPGEPLPAGLPAADFRRRVSHDAASKFLNFQLLLNMCDRGWLETTYYQLGSDYRGTLTYLLSYMSQLGGWAILDYGLHLAQDPTDYLRPGYASSLSSWALVNSGTAASGYGYWFPSKENDGATGGGFMPEAMGRGWIGKQMSRGAWYYSAEEDVGYCGALRTHATILTRDPVFGEIVYGGTLLRQGSSVSVIPRDGLRVRFHVVRSDQRLHLVLDHDGYAKEQPIVVADDLSRIRFTLENRTGRPHQTGLTVAGLPPGDFAVTVGGQTIKIIRGGSQDEQKVGIPVGAAATTQVNLTRSRR